MYDIVIKGVKSGLADTALESQVIDTYPHAQSVSVEQTQDNPTTKKITINGVETGLTKQTEKALAMDVYPDSERVEVVESEPAED
jgi:hypothetical protein